MCDTPLNHDGERLLDVDYGRRQSEAEFACLKGRLSETLLICPITLLPGLVLNRTISPNLSCMQCNENRYENPF